MGRCTLYYIHSNALRTRRQCLKKPLVALAAVLRRHLRAGAIALVNALVLLAHSFSLPTGSTDSSLVTKVGVNADKIRGQAERAHILDDDFAWRLGLVVGAVSAAAVQFASVHDGVVLDGHGSGAVVLHYLVDGFLCSSTDDCGIARSED